MNVPSYEVGRVAALTVRLMRASGLSHDDALAALGLASRMMDDERATVPPAPMRPTGMRPPQADDAVTTRRQ